MIGGMEQPHRNIELKAHDRNSARSIEACRALGAEDRLDVWQPDIYLEVAHGGLELRENAKARVPCADTPGPTVRCR